MAKEAIGRTDPVVRLERDLERILNDKPRRYADKTETETSQGGATARYIWVAGRDGLFAMTPEQLQEWCGARDSL